ncbi:ATP-binding protein [Paenibacillus rhizovicinus]|uniref:ATP-binding protein n=1 Tax=Paenibacillus rhizovicinus TaxID=2704463 RepID=UPI001CDC6EED|nr:ATP-binding protein [Paenibacillus rhizovicinus]
MRSVEATVERRKKLALLPYAWITIGVAALSVVLHEFGFAFDAVNIALMYLFPVLFSAVYWGLVPSFYAAAAGVLAFDYFFVPPFLSFSVEDLRYLLSFAVYLAVAALTATLAARLKQQVKLSKEREAHTAALYSLSRQMAAVGEIKTLLENIALQVSVTVQAQIAIYMPDARSELARTAYSPGDHGFGEGESAMVIAKWTFEHGRMAGRGTETLGEFPGLFVPLRTEERTYGVLAVRADAGALSAESRHLLEAFGGLAATAIARVKLSEEAKLAQLTAESERIRTALLDSVSHELRTPLATVIGSATGLIDGEDVFSSDDRRELLVTIRDGALRMNRLVTNLLGMVKLESGMLALRRDWVDAEDMIGVVLSQVRGFVGERRIEVRIQEPTPYFPGDEVLLEQVLVNVVSNAIKYSPDGSEVVIAVRQSGSWVRISVADNGIGIGEEDRERIFDKFYRGPGSNGTTGTGLGLAICKGIVEAHGGTITAAPRAERGTVVTVALPAGKPELPEGWQREEEEQQ